VTFLVAVGVTLVASFALVPFGLVLARLLGLYLVVQERRCVVFELFGKVRAVIDTPGLHCPWLFLGPFAMLVPFFGKKYVVDLRLDPMYLRRPLKLAVNSEGGAPMGIGVWCEMFVNDPVAYLYKNADPRGSLLANVSNATVRCLSNMKLDRMLERRRQRLRAQGALPGRGDDCAIEQKVVNRLRQVTAAIQQDGSNRVNIIRSAADREAAIELAKAGAMRPRIVGGAIAQIARRADVCNALFDVLEIQQLTWAEGLVVQVIPKGADVLAQMSAVAGVRR
jgi:hypothetical protein